MSYYPEDQSDDNLKKLRNKNVCKECGGPIWIYIDMSDPTHRKYLACSTPGHEGIARVFEQSRYEYENSIRRLTELEQTHGREVVVRTQQVPTTGQLTQAQAMHILKLVYPDAPEDEIIRCAILCRDFGLHPLMKEVYLIPFKKKWKDAQGKWHEKENYVTVLGINATRKLMAKRGTFSYLDNTPRIMTEEEQSKIFGEVDAGNFVAITKLRTREGEEAQGYGKWPNDSELYGTDKGNTRANMAFIRSERNAFGRLFTDAIPQDVEIIDEAYAEGPDMSKVDLKTGEIIEGEVTEVEEKKEPKAKAKAQPEEAQQELIPETPAEKDETPVTSEQLTHLSELMKQAGMTTAALGKYMNVDKKWNIRKLGDLQKWQYNELCIAFEKGLA